MKQQKKNTMAKQYCNNPFSIQLIHAIGEVTQLAHCFIV